MLDTTKVALCYPNYTDSSLLSGGSYLPTLPLSYAQQRVLAQRARSTDLLPASTQFTITLPQYYPVGAIAIASHNFTTLANIRVRAYTDVTQTTLLYDSGLINVWPAIYDSSRDLEWEYDNFWLGTPGASDLVKFTPLFTNFFVPVIAQSVLVEIFDPTNPKGYVEFGRVFISNIFQPQFNMVYGVNFGYDNFTQIDSALDVTEYFDRKRQKRTMQFSLDAMQDLEAFQSLYAMKRDLGTDGELIVAYNLDTTQPDFFARTFLARNKALNAISQPYISRFTTSLDFIEII
jgi:hypothetical protein